MTESAALCDASCGSRPEIKARAARANRRQADLARGVEHNRHSLALAVQPDRLAVVAHKARAGIGAEKGAQLPHPVAKPSPLLACLTVETRRFEMACIEIEIVKQRQFVQMTQIKRWAAAHNDLESVMKKTLIPAISLGLLAGAFLSPAMAAGPRVSDSNDWPGMSQSVNPRTETGYQPDAATHCGVYDTYCYYNGRLSLDNSGRNR